MSEFNFDKLNFIDEMRVDSEPDFLESTIQFIVTCSECGLDHPLEKVEWQEGSGWHIDIRIKPHLCVWKDDELPDFIKKFEEWWNQ